jgi:hypothetical protein
MKTTKRRLVLGAVAVVVAMAGAMAAPGGRLAANAADNPNVVIDWNQTMLAALATAKVPAPASMRLGAIVQAAVFDAVNGIGPQYTPVHVAPAAPDRASQPAAAVGAAYTALVSLFPSQKPTLDADLAASVAALRGNHHGSSSPIGLGLSWGDSVAAQIVAWRSTDGFSSPPSPYLPGTSPGDWQPTPGGSGLPKFQTLATTTPFALTSPSQFRPAGPPAVTSAKYTRDFNEVMAFGGATSSARTTYQTETATFWQGDTPTDMWDRVADSLAQERHLNLLKTARLLAFVNLAEADASFAVWDAKTTFNFWRPVTAIAQAALDGNPNTNPEAGWLPLLVTPYFQEYPSAHSGVSSAAVTVLESFFGDRVEFTVTSNGLPGVERSFNRLSDAIAQVGDARVFAGFHFRFSVNDGARMGVQVARYAESRLMRPVDDAEE